MAAILDDCERTATVALPTAATSGFISGEVGISAALDAFATVYELPLTRFKKGQTKVGTSAAFDAFSTVYQLPLTRFKNGQTDTHTKIRTRTITLPRCATPTRGNKLDGVARTQTSRLLLCYYSSRSHGTVCTAIGKGRNYCRSIPRDPPHGKNGCYSG